MHGVAGHDAVDGGPYAGVLTADVLLAPAGRAVDSLKHKRAVLRPVLARLRRLEVSVCEAGAQDLHRRATIGIGCVAADPGQLQRVLDSCERQLAGEPELELLAVRRRVHGPDD